MDSDEEFADDQAERQEALMTPPTNRNLTNLHLRIQSPFKRYMTSSTAKRKQTKQSDCKFCDRNIPAPSLIDHLKSARNKKCLFLYSKMYGVTNFKGLVSKLFSCEMCYKQERIDVVKHLKKNRQCLAKFRQKFQVEDIEEIHKKLKEIKRQTFPSRISKECKTVSESVNEYRQKVALGNFKLCIQCHSNFREYGAKMITENDELFERFKLSSEEKKSLRRFEAFYICNNCAKTEDVITNDKESKSNLAHYEEHGNVAFFPTKDTVSEASEPINQRHVKLWYPYTLEAVENSFNFGENKYTKENLNNMYKTKAVKNSDISALYQQEYKKYESVKGGDEIYSGIIQDFETRRVNNIKKIASCSRITGSKDWFEVHGKRMKERHEQLGLIHATITIDLPIDSPDILATALIQDGLTVTIENHGLGNGELEVSYKVHLDHKCDTDCSPDCQNKVSLEEYITEHGFLIDDTSNKYFGTYVSSCHEKLISFAKLIIQAPASDLYCEDYQLYLSFDEKGMARIVGCIWPHELNVFNESIAKNNGEIADHEEELVRFIQQNISCTGEPKALRSIFHLSEHEANELSRLVLTKQFHNTCEEVENCEYCSYLPLPSMETVLKQKCTDKNYEASKDLLGRISLQLKSLSLEDRKGLKTWTFLQNFWTEVDGEISENGELLKMTFNSEDNDIEFEISDLLTKFLGKYEDSPKTGVYHYALACFGNADGSPIVLQRLWICDSWILPFNPLHLKSNKTTSVINIVNDTKLFQRLYHPIGGLHTQNEKVDPTTILSHRLISLTEAIAISDPKIKIIQSSTRDQYVNAKENRGVLLKKAKSENNSPFICVEDNEHYELLGDPISRHFNRLNPFDGLLLAETSSWYDFVGENKSKDLMETYRNCEIPISDEPSVCSNANLPQYILCTNGDVLKKRRKKKILVVPSAKTKREEMFLKSLLFLPIQSEQELHGHGCIERFEEVKRDEQALVVELNEKKMFPKKMFDLTGVDLLDDLLNALDEVSNDEQSEEELLGT